MKIYQHYTNKIFTVAICCVLLNTYSPAQNSNTIVVKANEAGATVQSTMWGDIF